MKCLIAGVGSIGRRHLRNLRSLGINEVVLYRRAGSSEQCEGEFSEAITEVDLNSALAHKPDFAVISNPTSLHAEVALACARANCHLFIEKPIAHKLDDCADLLREINNRNLIAMVGFQFRFHPGLWQIKRLLEEDVIGPVVSAQAHWGEYLPAWHPWEDHRQSYSARDELGGGVILTLCHPFDYLRWLLGEVAEVSAMMINRGGLEIEVEDTAQVQMRFESGAIANVHLDYVQRPADHWLQITGQRGVLRWDNSDGKARWFDIAANQWKEFSPSSNFERNTMFIDEMHHFIQCVSEHQQPLCTFDDGVAALKIALTTKESARQKRTLSL
ncbi:MAG TPA: Gfo/Idh/MocA family oxidoreductase [Blastocatellia bacterium]|nr:Gfo/Idh/MocA family oxidoreductase [Blastocatellia bacterium]